MIRFLGVVLWVCFCAVISGFAQDPTAKSLTQKLLAEDSIALASDAREKGDPVRGSILFAQQSLNCTVCHSQGASDLLGPDLTRVGINHKDEYFVESILRPSKIISKGFESVKILTRDGQTITGRIVRQDEQQFELRELSDKNRKISIARADVDRMQADTVSAMPEKLADQLSSRQQFLDLVKYIMDLAQTGPLTDAPTDFVQGGGTVEDRIAGLALIDRFGCVNCHGHQPDSDRPSSLFPKKQGPDLSNITARIDPAYLESFIADPHQIQPGTSMPNILRVLSPQDRSSAASAITQYLVSLSEPTFQRQAIDADSSLRGGDLFQSVGCVACHSPKNEHGVESKMNDSVALEHISAKYSVHGLASFLENPHSIRPTGRMPDMGLSHWEAIDLASYLLQNGVMGHDGSDATESNKIDDGKVSAGRDLYSQLGCVQCHSNGDVNDTTTGNLLRDGDLAKVDLQRGCLSGKPGQWPRYQLTEPQREAIETAIRQLQDPLSDQQHIVLTMETFRCYRCHQRDDLGGVTDVRDPFFHTTNPNLGPQGRIPPTLTGVGGKLKPKWLREVLVSGRAIRPYMRTRMPQYGADNIGHLGDLLSSVDQKPTAELAPTGDHKETRKIGADLVGSAGLNCVACHTFQQKPSQTMPAVDLTEMSERLHKEWFYRYMLSPQSLSPGTVMPSFWPGGKAIREQILDGNSSQQIGAIWEYLLDGRQARAPRGLHHKPIELLATNDRAVMLRRSYQGIGKRGIGVGYPGEVNLAYDAQQMRLAMIWRGRFADPGSAWRGQGSGNVRPLGKNLIRFEPGPDIDHDQTPQSLVNRRPPNHQFTGYRLDDHGRPTFSYRIDDVDVQDYFVDLKDPVSKHTLLKRTLTLTVNQSSPNLHFRVANGKTITMINNHTFRVDDSLRIQIAPPHQAKIVAKEAGQRLTIPINLQSGSTKIVLRYSW